MAPSAHNAQPWRFIVIDDSQVKMDLANRMSRVLRRDLLRDGLPESRIDLEVEASLSRIEASSLVVVVCLSLEGMDSYPDQKRRRAEYKMAMQSVSASIENLLLAIHYEGLGACWRCSPLFVPQLVRKYLGIPDNVEPVALIEIGHIMEEVVAPSRIAVTKATYHNTWGEPY